MTVIELVKNCSFWLLVAVIAVIFAVSLHSSIPKAVRTSEIGSYCFAVLIALYATFELWRSVLRWRLSNPEFLERTAKKLWKSDPMEQRTAMMRLGLVLGDRFGNPLFFFGQNHKRRCELWKEWWERSHDSLAWYAPLRLYVETHAPRREVNAGFDS